MNDQNTLRNDHLIEEARALIRAAYRSTDDSRMSTLLNWAYEIVKPLAEAKIPEALWLACSLSQIWGETVDEKAFHDEYQRRLREAADAGAPEAQFKLANDLYAKQAGAASALYRAAAEKGHAHAQWCYGLNLLGGSGVPKDTELGASYILKAGEGKFEGAIRFLAEAHATGSHGFPKDETTSVAWWKKLSDQDVIRY